jgi:bifunctional DNA-binding transcriptional regulator/antitoxin component of YhaV-PrlF toxin-antitoxin module
MERAESRSVRLRSRGVLTLPKSLRDKYDLGEGDALHLVDAGGAFVLTPMEPMVPSLSAKIEQVREETGLSITELLDRLQEERVALVRERYGDPPEGREGPNGREGPSGEEGKADRDPQTRPDITDE